MDAQGPVTPPAQLAKGALRRLAAAKLEPTPANYTRAYADEAGEPLPPEGAMPPKARPAVDRLVMRVSDDALLRAELSAALMEARYDDLQRALDRSATAAASAAQAWALLIDRLARGLARGARHWTGARKKDSLQRVLEGSRSDTRLLQQRLGQLIGAWETDQPDADGAATGSPAETLTAEMTAADTAADLVPSPTQLAAPASPAAAPLAAGHPRLIDALQATVAASLPAADARAAELADELAVLAQQVQRDGATPALA